MFQVDFCLMWCLKRYANVALAVCPDRTWLTLEAGITTLLSNVQSATAHISLSPSVSLAPLLFLTTFSGSAHQCIAGINRPLFVTSCAEHPPPTTHSHSSCYRTDEEQQQLGGTQKAAEGNKSTSRRKGETTLGISISSSKALSWKRTQGLQG